MSTIGRYLTPDVVRLGLSGLAAGSVIGLVWRAGGRVRWGGLPFVLAVLAAARHTGRSDWFRWDGVVAVGVLVTLLAAVGAAHLLASPGVGWAWVAAGSLFSAAGVWGGVPETGPAVLVGGGLAGLVAATALTRSQWAPAAGGGVAAILGWAAVSGAAGRPWAAVGGVLCTGVAPWFALHPVLPTWSRSRAPGPWLLGVHMALVIFAARWIGVVPHAQWFRLTLLVGVGLAAAVTTRHRA